MDLEIALERRPQVEEFQRRHRTGLLTLLFTDLVDSTRLKQDLGDVAGVGLIRRHHAITRQILGGFSEAEEISVAGDSFFLVFVKPSDAVRFGLLLQAALRRLSQEAGKLIVARIGVHIGEVVIEQHEDSARRKDLYGIQVDIAARVMSLAKGNQILLTRSTFDNARQVLKGQDIPGISALTWLDHGPYVLKGVEDRVEVCEVGEAAFAPLKAPPDSEKIFRHVSPDCEPVLGWRPALDQIVPNTKWVLDQKLGEGGFGEVWLARHQALKEKRVFKFCFRADRVRSLKREVTLFRLLRERVGGHPNIVGVQEVFFDTPPYYLMMDYAAGQDLVSWCAAAGGVEAVSMATRLEIIAQVADALQAAHDAGIIHRDVKPANILVARHSAGSPPHAQGEYGTHNEEGTSRYEGPASYPPASPVVAKLTDFGIGQVVSQEALAGMTRMGFTQTMLSTGSSSQTGTLIYMDPELIAGKPASPHSDIYSLGVLLYQLIVGDLSRPLTTEWTESIADPLLKDDLKQCFAGNPQDRFPGAGHLARNLRMLEKRQAELAERQAANLARERAAYRRGMIRTAFVAVLIVACFALLAAYAFQQAARATRSAMAEAKQKHLLEKEKLVLRENLYVADIYRVQYALEKGNLGLVRTLLNSHQPSASSSDLRGFEWRLYWQMIRGDQLQTWHGHSNTVTRVAFSPDGKRLASGSEDQTITIRDVSTGKVLAVLPAPTGVMAHSITFSPDGQTLVVSGDTVVRFWDAKSKKPKHVIQAAFPRFVFSPAGTWLAMSIGGYRFGGTASVNVWDRTGTRILRTIPNAGQVLAALPDGTTLATGSWSAITLWDLSTGIETRSITGAGRVYWLAASPDGRVLASTSTWESEVRLWDVESGQPLPSLKGHNAMVWCGAFSPDGKTLATASSDQTVRLWNVSTQREIARLNGHESEVHTVVFSPDGKTLATGSKDETVRLWDAEPRKEVPHIANVVTSPLAPVFSPDGELLATGSSAGRVELWEVATSRLKATFPTDQHVLAFSPDGSAVATLSNSQRLNVWDISTRSNRASVSLGTDQFPIDAATRSADSTILLTLGAGVVTRWNLATMDVIDQLPVSERGDPSLALSPNGHMLATASKNHANQVKLWSLVDRKELATLSGHKAGINCLVFSLDNELLASASNDGSIKLWSVAGRIELATLTGHKEGVLSLAVSPDGKTLASGSGDQTMKLWNWATHREVGTLKHDNPVWYIGFSPDGRTLAFGTYTGNLTSLHAPSLAECDVPPQ